jgi:FixJ family two-component response regulator
MKNDTPIIYVLDDDYRVREALSSLFLSMGHRVEVFASAAEYLVFKRPDSPACLAPDPIRRPLSFSPGTEMSRPLFAQ